MKKLFVLSLLFFALSSVTYAQTMPDFSKIKLEVKADYDKNANDAALTAANYLLNNPIDKESMPRLNCAQYMIRWMTGTPDYTFTLEAGKIFKKNDDLLVVYMAALTKFCMENKLNGKEGDQVRLGAHKLLAAYCKKENNNVKQTSEIKKLVSAYESNTLEEYLGIKK